jgi:hypothetical protein
MAAESPECTGVISGRGRRRPRIARRGGEGGGGRGGAAPSPGEGSRGPASDAAHLDVRDAVVDRDERLCPEERESACGRGGDLERAAHAGGLGVADAGEVGGGDSGPATLGVANAGAVAGGDAGPATPRCDAVGSRRGGRIGGEQGGEEA